MKKQISARTKKLIINIAVILAILIAISIATLLILTAFGVVSFEDGIVFNPKLFDSFKSSWYGWIIFILFQTILTMLLSPIPGVSMALIILCTQVYENSWEAFIFAFSSVMLSSFVMYMIGKFGGYKLCEKILGEEDCEKSLKLLSNKSTVYFPVMMMMPIFPDDALVMIAGTLKMKLSWFIPSIVFGRGIGIATIVFGFSLIPFSEFNGIYDWLIFFTMCFVWMEIVFRLANKINKKIEQNNK